ncbi:uncharacterized protein LOC100747358 [Bombus impatiens]|uniref:Uncharacterized protein LOC100747358 n=1 Tax=Bombus impatiens TaxID=132113 RepID=A0A6P3DT33_BOMIM|nr:uncharacterized protein LOC100747358 [Bombus impatiens]
MVKIVRKLAFIDAMKGAYHKPFWQRIKHLWFEFRESNQAVAAYAPLTVIVCIPLIVIVTYGKMHANPVVKYYDHINIYRPDDPRAALIRKDYCLRYSISAMFDTIHMPNTI